MKFWKVAVLQLTKTKISAAAFIIGQRSVLPDDFGMERKFTRGLRPYSVEELVEQQIQVPIAEVEKDTDLDFGDLKSFDKVAGLESTRQIRQIRSVEDIII